MTFPSLDPAIDELGGARVRVELCNYLLQWRRVFIIFISWTSGLSVTEPHMYSGAAFTFSPSYNADHIQQPVQQQVQQRQ